jgi:hypothetical protein
MKFKINIITLVLVIVIMGFVNPIYNVSSYSNIYKSQTRTDLLPGKNNLTSDGLDKFIYLPLVLKNYPKINTFGIDSGGSFDKVAATGVSWLLVNSQLNWSAVESTKGTYTWSNVASLESNLVQASQLGLQAILIISQSPTWARKYTDKGCGPIKSTEILSFANFMSEVVKRYSAPPYNVKYYQIWNEPDAPVGLPGDSVFGCWGEVSYKNDPYFGGEYYGDMLKQVYAKVKAANPAAQVLVGGLLLDCDPRSKGPGYCSGEIGHDPSQWNFFEGVVKKAGSQGFDYVPFHGYTYFATGENPVWQEIHTGGWSASGGQVNGKIGYLKSIMSKYNVNKPLMLTESSILYGSQDYTGPYPEDYQQAKADYIVWTNANTWSRDIKATVWYTFFGWRGSQLIANGTPLPAYNSLKSMIEILKYADFQMRDESNSGFAKFIYYAGNQEIWLLVPTGEYSGIPYTISKPINFQKLLDLYGVEQSVTGDTISFARPTYILINR